MLFFHLLSRAQVPCYLLPSYFYFSKPDITIKSGSNSAGACTETSFRGSARKGLPNKPGLTLTFGIHRLMFFSCLT